ncbi:MAG: CPBP family intramembrane glutamic endopeptidase [Elusimicrobiota bacterium]|jgi:membrane protease YdiL (CAAX protease family)
MSRRLLAVLLSSALLQGAVVPAALAQTVVGTLAASRGAVTPLAFVSPSVMSSLPGLNVGIRLETGTLPSLNALPQLRSNAVAPAPAGFVPSAFVAPKAAATASPGAHVAALTTVRVDARTPVVGELLQTGKELSNDADGKNTPGVLRRLFELGGLRRSAQDEALPTDASGTAARPVEGPAPSSVEGLKPSVETSASAAAIPAPATPEGTPPSFKRAAILGFLLAGVQLTLEYVVPLVAAYFGYECHANYAAKVFGAGNPLFPAREPSLAGVVGMAFKGGLLAPLVEEVLYRAGVMEWVLKGLTRLGIPRAAPWIAALSTSLFFVCLHETADPLMIGIRLVGALMLSYAYYKEGLMSSIVMHALHNGFPGVQAVLRVGVGPDAKTLFTVAAALVYAGLAWLLVKLLRKGPQGAVSNRRYPWPEDVK